MIIDNAYDIKDLVYLITDPDQLARIVCQINITRNEILYVLACGTTTSNHYAYEISRVKDLATV
jgi:hypothetical protein